MRYSGNIMRLRMIVAFLLVTSLFGIDQAGARSNSEVYELNDEVSGSVESGPSASETFQFLPDSTINTSQSNSESYQLTVSAQEPSATPSAVAEATTIQQPTIESVPAAMIPGRAARLFASINLDWDGELFFGLVLLLVIGGFELIRHRRRGRSRLV